MIVFEDNKRCGYEIEVEDISLYDYEVKEEGWY